jgi:hypothetical protein
VQLERSRLEVDYQGKLNVAHQEKVGIATKAWSTCITV